MIFRTCRVSTWVARAVFCFIFTSAAVAQVVTDSGIGGIVTDPSGAPVASASVNARHQATGASWNAITNDNGFYSFAVLPPGRYTLTCKREGFQTVVVTDRVIAVAEPAQVDIKLSIGNVTDRITVSA